MHIRKYSFSTKEGKIILITKWTIVYRSSTLYENECRVMTETYIATLLSFM